MEFSGQYLDYNEYRSLGGTLDKTPFNLLEFKARMKINERTQNRLVGITNMPQEVKICVFEIMNALERYQKMNSNDNSIASESIDGYSVTYANSDNDNKTSEYEEFEDIMMNYLSNVRVNNIPVLFLGVC